TPQAAMPPPMATPSSTRGRRVRNRISALGSGKNIFSKARRKSTVAGPIREQPSSDNSKRRNRQPLTRIIFLRSRTFTSTLPTGCVIWSGHEAFGLNETGDLFQSLPDSRARAKDLVRWITIDASIFHSGDRL